MMTSFPVPLATGHGVTDKGQVGGPGFANTHIPQALMLQNSLMIDSTDFRTGDNENAASIIKSVGADGATCRTE
jgi:hypothetical protein